MGRLPNFRLCPVRPNRLFTFELRSVAMSAEGEEDEFLDPRRVLRMINDAGVRDVDARQLKVFMTDLKKIIHHDRRVSENEAKPVEEVSPKTARRACSCTDSCGDRKKSVKRAKSLIKVPVDTKPKKTDVLSRYRYYASQWEKYKSNLPGEDGRSQLRWSIRERLSRKSPLPPVPITRSEGELRKKREGWTKLFPDWTSD